jgi:hypothetical protein
MGENQEAMGGELVAKLSAAGIDARASGAGVNWQVDVGPVASRRLRVHCFWYERVISGIMIGPDPSNSRSLLEGPSKPPYEGPEYLVILHADGVRAADGRTESAADVVACARVWLDGVELDQLVREVPFVDERRREMHALAQRLDEKLRWDIAPDPGYALWVYGDGRSCKLWGAEGAAACSFWLGQQQVALHAAPDDVPAAVASWLVDRAPLRELVVRVPGVELERHAEVLELDPARWHWLHVRDRIADPDNMLAPLRDLIEALAASPVATRFYSYSSMNRLCFSASSHFLWVNAGLPIVQPDEAGVYLVDETPCDLTHAIQRIEEILASHPVRPFFGSAAHHELPLLAECLARQHSELRPQLVQQGAFYKLVVAEPSGQRRCTVEGTSVVFDASRRTSASWQTLEDAARAIRRYCEDREASDDIIADPAAVVVFHNGRLIRRPDR